ncbi:S4 domain containing protein [Trichomonas vaginalis G3]|uniref:S4 domain containing protein n=1 Tax=Trichomonas vaginalis (strain ATCC PRA-98 / G3) TaxID=412133 RepID=A2E3D0_TRIV3|nr:snoRNA binding [Trichomonas vaginalis G3]EAY12821.1 S4 domain containing protein [Trichomonas vaginalis G3]KAI5488521.1 snoRNA binding [Trichomonas vaginalis G3]|eukprot:XP_001325044.1 S4 domain containing protein [Trichomonas vaginalis G3]
MGRKLKYHEQKLLKKTNLYHWKGENNLRSGQVVGIYCLDNSEEYHQYNRLVGKIQRFTNTLRQMGPEDKVRIDLTKQFVDRVYKLGIIETPQLSECEKINVVAICKRRLPVIMVNLKFCQRISEADKLVRQGHVRIGPDVVTNPATLVSKEMEDYINWAHGSKIEAHVKKFNQQYDDFDNLE